LITTFCDQYNFSNVVFSLFLMFNWYWRYVSYLKEEMFRLYIILKNALFDDFQKTKSSELADIQQFIF